MSPPPTESALGRAYRRLYEGLCGRHPHHRAWHFEWLPLHFLNRTLSGWLAGVSGRVLDVGCGQQPYRPLLKPEVDYVGMDASPAARAEVVAAAHEPWPFPDASFDAVLMTQVMEYVPDPHFIAAEMVRVLKPGGSAVVTLPFLFNEHGPADGLRLSLPGVRAVFREFDFLEVHKHGGIGSTLTILCLNWLDTSLNARRATRLCRPLLLPVWMPLCLLLNLLGLAVNTLDHTGHYYSNLCVRLRKPM